MSAGQLLRRLVFVAAALLPFRTTAAAAGELAAWTDGKTPPLVLADMAGKEHDLSRYRGKVVLVNFWATWCGPCREEMPSMERLRQRYAQAPFAVLAVNVDEPEQRIRAFLEKMPLNFAVLPDPGMRVTRAWNARVLPASFLVGPDGRIRYSVRGALDWSSEAVAGKVADLFPQGR